MSSTGTAETSANRWEGVPLGDQGGAGQSGELLAPHPVALDLVASGEPVHVVAVAAERVYRSRRVVLGQQGAEHRWHRPAVGDDVVHGLHQDGAACPGTDERVPHQGSGGEVEPGPAVPFGEVADLLVGEGGAVQGDEGRGPATLDDGYDPAVGEGGEAGGQVGIEGEQPGGGRGETVGVHVSVQGQQLLLDVGAGGVVVVDGVEVEALLQRGQRQDVVERRAVQGVDVGLGQRYQREVAGGVATGFERGE